MHMKQLLISLMMCSSVFGAGLVNPTLSSTGGVTLTDLTNATAGMITSNQLAQILPLDGVLVVPYTNIPAQFLGTKVFSPQLGSNYVQQAVNYLPFYPGNVTICGGGTILVCGQNYCPGILLTNGPTSINSYKFIGTAYNNSALVFTTLPGLTVDNGSAGNPTIYLTLKDMVISSISNNPAYLIKEVNGVSHNEWIHNKFGYWNYVTNNYVFSADLGIGDSCTYPNLSSMVNNLVIQVSTPNGEKGFYDNNRFTGLGGIYCNDDHAEWHNNLFGACGNRNTGWTTASPFWTGGCFVLPSATAENIFFHTDFYDCTAGYYQMVSAGNLKGTTTAIHSQYDKYETDTYSVLHVGTIFEQINPLAMLSVHSATVSGTTITDDGSALGVKYTSDIGSVPTTYALKSDATNIANSATAGMVTNNASGVNLSGTFTGDGSGLTNLNSVCQTNDSRAVTLTNANNVFGGTFGISSASYSKGILKIEKEIPLSELGWVVGLNPNLGNTPSPFFTRPAVTMWTGSASEGYTIPIPQWVTNLILRLQYEYTGADSPTWTNRSATEISWPVIGRVGLVQNCIFTLQPTNYIYVMVTNTFPDMQGTNCVKYISYDVLGLGNPNTATPINITGIHAWMTGKYDGTNW